MRIKSVEFAGAIGQVGQAQPATVAGMPQVAFSGRSNVGKSSLINRLLGRTRTAIARVSAQPGKTQEINFYLVRAEPADFVLVDLPGYGYAKVPKELRDRWQPLIGGFLSASRELSGVVQLIDLRTGPTPDDLKSVDYLAELGIPTLFALTKADKLGKIEGEKEFAKAVKKLGVDPDQAIAFSSLKGTGREELLETLEALLFPQEPAADETDPSPAEG
ncbi:MAG TPA: ribosome biogenesis GTP-binding protein YihA/YsxC [Longimicrobium sp.]|nr:ribosome biogenesis GTP-binding protein YihA/YsxC [Longimicrobium sp.]